MTAYVIYDNPKNANCWPQYENTGIVCTGDTTRIGRLTYTHYCRSKSLGETKYFNAERFNYFVKCASGGGYMCYESFDDYIKIKSGKAKVWY